MVVPILIREVTYGSVETGPRRERNPVTSATVPSRDAGGDDTDS